MFARCIKNYFHSLRYVFSALGVMFLALMIGISILISGYRDTITTMVNDVRELTDSTDLSMTRITESFANTFKKQDADERRELASIDGTEEFVTESIGDAIAGTVDNYANYAVGIAEIIGVTVTNLLLFIGVFALWQVLGVIFAGTLTQYFIRTDIEKRNIFKAFAARFVHCFFVILTLAIVVLVGYKWNYAGLVLLALYPFFYCFITLFSAYVTSGKGRPKFRTVVRPRAIFALFAANLVSILFSILIGAVIFAIGSGVIGAYVAVALFIVSAAVTSLNASVIVEFNKEKACVPVQVIEEVSEEIAEALETAEANKEIEGQSGEASEADVTEEDQETKEIEASKDDDNK